MSQESEQYLRKQIKIARVWASIDGCEGADLIEAMCGVIEMAHYSNAMNELGIQNDLLGLISIEVEAIKTMALSDDPEEFGYDEYFVGAAIEAIKKIEDED